MKNFVMIAAGAVLLLIAVPLVRTLMLPPPAASGEPPATPQGYDSSAIAAHLSGAVQIRTISWGDDHEVEADAFSALAAFLEDTYPTAHELLTKEVVGGHSVLFHWKGTDATLKPIGLMAHMDVVPVEPGTDDQWTRPAFSGDMHDGAVWGRGTLDDKGALITIMEAVEKLASQGFTPSRDIYLIFGHDEEVGGPDGAGNIAALLKSRSVELAFTLDEGSGLVDGIIPGVARPLALIATAEKGFLTIRLTAKARGGHSSTPDPETAVSLAASAVATLTDHPFDTKIDENVVAFLRAIAPEMPFAKRLVLTNLWLTGGFVKNQLAGDPVTAASLHTTTAPTIISGGAKANILPQQAQATINFRIHPRDSVASIIARTEKLISDDRITLDIVEGNEPSPQSSTKSDAYRAIEKTTRKLFGDVPTAPSLMLAGTDSKHFGEIADDNYRFAPFIYTGEDMAGIHGANEHVAIDSLARAAAWYEAFIKETAGQ